MLVSGVLNLVRAITRLPEQQVPRPVRIALAELAAALAVADDEPAAAIAHAAAAAIGPKNCYRRSRPHRGGARRHRGRMRSRFTAGHRRTRRRPLRNVNRTWL
ncbi:transmembrane alanine and valine and leucine rich domain protein, partial [Mycobacterium ulcerans str. Harvey]